MKKTICIFLLFTILVFPLLTSCAIGGSTISFVSYGAYDPVEQVYNAGQTITTLPPMSKFGFKFVGWSFKENSTEIIYLPTTAGTTDITLYAVYEIDREMFISDNAIDPSKNETYQTFSYNNTVLLYNSREVTQLTITDDLDSIQSVSIHNCNGKTLEYTKNGNTYIFEPTVGDIVVDISTSIPNGVTISFNMN